MGQEVPTVAIARLRATWDREVGPSARRALLGLAVAVFFCAAHVGRIGSLPARVGAAAAFAALLAAMAVRAVVLRRRRADPRRVVHDTVARMDPVLGAATLRALGLVERTAVDDRAGSPALAALHLERLLARASLERLALRAVASAARWSAVGLACAVLAVAAVVIEPFRIVEGLDVLASQDGEAPLRLAWIDQVEMVAVPPEYLRSQSAELRPFSLTSQPRGTVITVRGRPLHAGRPVMLTDGRTDVPFIDDGGGGLIARWTLGGNTTLWVAANFGGVRIRQASEQVVSSIPDQVPVVRVDGAPRTARLLDEPSIPIHYEATDDHGLREVDLVLRAGTREERRVLSHPAADVLVDRGGYEIHAKDPFFKKTYTPVEITVEARDNDVVAGPKWGKSPAIMVIPPQVGEPEALRYAALLKARDALTDLTAFRVTDKAPVPATAKAHAEREAEEQLGAVRAINEALGGTYGGLAVRGRFVALARGQLRRLARALAAEKKSPVAARHQKLLDETEDALLALDSGVRGLGYRDSQAVARRLADVADEAAAGLAATPAAADQAAAAARVDAAIVVLDGGGKQLLKLGELGLDLGEIVANDLRRVARAREARDLPHAELAARDLAARLRRPDPSFMGGGGGRGSGGGGRGGGVESGGSPGADAGDPSAADEESAASSRELEELAQDHGGKIRDVEEALEKAISNEELEALRQEAKQHADALREAVKRLPPPRSEMRAAEAAAAAAREEAEAMAGALEGGRLREAIESGKRAAQKMAEAKRLAEQSGGSPREEVAGREAAAAKPTVDRELGWAEDALAKMRAASSARAKGDLAREGKAEQKLAERAKDLAKKGDSGDRSMPQEMLDRLGDAERTMRDAEKALGQGDGENALRLQRDAQRLLEMAMGERDESERERGQREDGRHPTGKTEIPDKNKHKGPEEFRRRVLKGLGGGADPLLREAVRRYAEGLLK
jgi:hypothetical protein